MLALAPVRQEAQRLRRLLCGEQAAQLVHLREAIGPMVVLEPQGTGPLPSIDIVFRVDSGIEVSRETSLVMKLRKDLRASGGYIRSRRPCSCDDSIVAWRTMRSAGLSALVSPLVSPLGGLAAAVDIVDLNSF